MRKIQLSLKTVVLCTDVRNVYYDNISIIYTYFKSKIPKCWYKKATFFIEIVRKCSTSMAKFFTVEKWFFFIKHFGILGVTWLYYFIIMYPIALELLHSGNVCRSTILKISWNSTILTTTVLVAPSIEDNRLKIYISMFC